MERECYLLCYRDSIQYTNCGSILQGLDEEDGVQSWQANGGGDE